MSFRKRSKTEDGISVQFIRAVKEMTDRVKAEEPYRMLQKQQEMREIGRKTFLNEARKVFTEDQVAFMQEYIAKRIY